ncbi:MULTISPECIES: HPP family protein [Bacillaceae]|uniref:HPP family protein n=1 Tax=Bacillaceae TaxID=186817 RepID=UPI0006D16156|nr:MULTISPECIES: HPP family protein [Bacillaceae]
MRFERESSKLSLLYEMFITYISKMKGEQGNVTRINLSDNIISAIGGLITISIVSVIAVALGYPMVLGPIGASCLLVFAAHHGPFSQPRHILGGHFVSTLAALAIWDMLGKSHLTIGLTLAVVLILMILLNVMHPPAAASAIVAINSQSGWIFLLTVIISSLVVIAISVLYNNLFKDRNYPKQWM